jgi:hypothetical protein
MVKLLVARLFIGYLLRRGQDSTLITRTLSQDSLPPIRGVRIFFDGILAQTSG